LQSQHMQRCKLFFQSPSCLSPPTTQPSIMCNFFWLLLIQQKALSWSPVEIRRDSKIVVSSRDPSFTAA
jgi:hypothetical protein